MGLLEIFSHAFMLRAFIVGVLISVVAAIIGVSLVLRKQSMLGDGLSHVAFGAFALATVLGFTPLWFSLPVVIFVSFLILHLNQNSKLSGDASIALLSASSLAIGTLAISISKGVNIDLNSYLFGSILSVGWSDVVLSTILAILSILLYIFAHNRIFALTFDAEFARSIGINTRLYDAFFAIICSFVVVLGMRLLGALLISSLLIFPATISLGFSKSFKTIVLLSAFVSIFAFLIGLLLSYFFSLPTGATVVLVNLFVFVVAKILDFLRKV